MLDFQCALRWAGIALAVLSLAACRLSAQENKDASFEGSASARFLAAGDHIQRVDSFQNAQPGYVAGLSMREAMRRAISHSPVLHAARAEIEARHGEAFQAGRRQNPELMTEVENFAGSGDFSGSDSAELTVSLTQVLELGGKRLKRLELANLETNLAAWDFEAVRLKVASETLQSFVDVLAGQRRAEIRKEFESLTARLSESVSERVRAGKVSGIEASKAKVELARASVALEEERAALDVARQQLALFWGGRSPDFTRAIGELAATNHLPTAQRFRTYLDQNPNIARWADEMNRREATLALEKARRIPNLSVGGGIRRFEETDDSAVVASVSIALPLFDRNRGSLDAANARIAKGQYEREIASAELTRSFVDAYGKLRAAEAKLRSLDEKVLPAAIASYQASEQGFREGKYDLLNVLDAQRSLIETRLNIINTQAEFHKAKAVIEALIGRDLYSIR